MMYEPDMFEAAGCRIMRCELKLLDLPGKLSEMTCTDRDGHALNLFTADDDAAVGKLGSVRTENDTFAPYYQEFLSLKRRFAFNVAGYGHFALASNGDVILEEVEKFNAELTDLRQQVKSLLTSRYLSSWQNEYIRRFNPRLKCGLFLLPRFFIEDKRFIEQLAKTFKTDSRTEAIDINWLLEPSANQLTRKQTVHVKDAKGDVRLSYAEYQFAKLF